MKNLIKRFKHWFYKVCFDYLNKDKPKFQLIDIKPKTYDTIYVKVEYDLELRDFQDANVEKIRALHKIKELVYKEVEGYIFIKQKVTPNMFGCENIRYTAKLQLLIDRVELTNTEENVNR